MFPHDTVRSLKNKLRKAFDGLRQASTDSIKLVFDTQAITVSSDTETLETLGLNVHRYLLHLSKQPLSNR